MSTYSTITQRRNLTACKAVCAWISLASLTMHALTLTWLPPESGPEVAGYYVHARDASSSFFTKFDVGNVTMYTVPDLTPGADYSFYVTAFNAHGLESDPSNTFNYSVPLSNSGPSVIIDMTASSGQLESPMRIESETLSQQMQSGIVFSPVAGSGSVSFQFEVPRAGDYVIWCRMLAPSGFIDSIYVAVNDEQPDLYYPTEGADPDTWHWSRVNGLSTGLPYGLRVFGLNPGLNRIRFATADPYVSLSRILVTDDLNFIPEGMTRDLRPAPEVAIARGRERTLLRWETEPEKNYHVFYKNNLSDPSWLRPHSSSFIRASSTSFEWIDMSATPNRFYLVYAAP